MIDGKNFFNQPINSDFRTNENIRRLATGQGDDYITGCLLKYSYFKENYKTIAIDLSKRQVLDADSRAIQQICFTVNLARAENTKIFLLLKKQNKLSSIFHKER